MISLNVYFFFAAGGFLLSTSAQSPDLVVECTTPSGDYGSCVPLDTCAALVRLVSGGGPGSLQVLRKSQCGFVGTQPKVCCSNNANPILFRDPETTSNNENTGRVPPSTTTYNPQSVSTEQTFKPQLETETVAATRTPPAPLPPLTTLPPRHSQPGLAPRPPNVFPASQNPPFSKPQITKTDDGKISGSVTFEGTDQASKPTLDSISSVPSVHAQQTPRLNTTFKADELPSMDSCGPDTLTNKIYGGKNTSIDEFPWMALLKYSTGAEEHYGCGGALINQRYVLTAGHCVRTNHAILVQVRLGEWNLQSQVDCDTQFECNSPPLDINIEESVVHPGFDRRNLTNDIALIRLAQSVIYSYWIQPICLPDSRDQDYTGESFWVAGWGQTESGVPSAMKLKLEVRSVAQETCRVAYRRLGVMLGEGTLCAGGRAAEDTCAGDSGGPLMKLVSSGARNSFHAVGVVSLGPSRCGVEGWAGVYSKVSYYMTWIKSSLRP